MRAVRIIAVSAASLTMLLAGGVVASRNRGADVHSLEERVESLENQVRGLEDQLGRLRSLTAEGDRGSAVLRSRRAAPLPSDPINTSGLPVRGSGSPSIAIVEYAEFQCPACRRYFIDTWPLIDNQYVRTGLVRYFFHHLPLDTVHAMAISAAEAAQCAHRQSRFWEMHDL